MLKFEYWITLKDGHGYKPTMDDTEHNDICITIDAKNRATADRMIKALTAGNDNIIEYDGVCIS